MLVQLRPSQPLFSGGLWPLLRVLVLVVGVLPTAEADLRSEIDAIIDSPSTPAALWGVRIEQSEGGEVLYSRNGDSPFIPASVTKLVSTAVALDRLGPDYTFTTHLRFPTAEIPADGVIRGDLQIIGGGDPTLGMAEGAGGRKVLGQWARRLRQQGVRQVVGHVVGVDDIFADEPLAPGWAWDDEQYHFSAESSGLTIHGGTVGYRIDENKNQRLRKNQIHLYPDNDYVQLHLRVSSEVQRIEVERLRGSNHLMVKVPQSMKRNPLLSGRVTVTGTTEWTAALFLQALEEQGIEVVGKAVDSDYLRDYRPADGLVWTHHSKPLREILPLANKRSINLVAEHLLRASGIARNSEGAVTHSGSLGRGLSRVGSFLSKIGIKKHRYEMVDGSGLSRYNLLRPADLVKLLNYMERHPQGEHYRNSLSRAGKDGTLQWRFRDTPLEGRVWAKTGTLSSIRAIAGHLQSAAGKRITFAILVNNYPFGSRKIRNRIDQILLAVARAVDR